MPPMSPALSGIAASMTWKWPATRFASAARTKSAITEKVKILRDECRADGLAWRLDRAARGSCAISHACQRLPDTTQYPNRKRLGDDHRIVRQSALCERLGSQRGGQLVAPWQSAGTSTLVVRTRSGFCWAAFTDTRRPNSTLDGDLDKLVWKMVSRMKTWHG